MASLFFSTHVVFHVDARDLEHVKRNVEADFASKEDALRFLKELKKKHKALKPVLEGDRLLVKEGGSLVEHWSVVPTIAVRELMAG